MRRLFLMAIGVIIFQSIFAQTIHVNYIGDSTTDFPNPERGVHVTMETQGSGVTNSFLNNLKKNQPAVTLIKRRYLLPSNSNPVIASTFLTLLQTELDRVRIAGMKMIVCIMYTNSPNGADAPLRLMLQHFPQLKPVFDKNVDVIAFFSLGFVGQFGEWTTTTNNNLQKDSMKLIVNGFLDNWPVSRMVTMRVPYHKRQVFGKTPVSQVEAYSTTNNSARVGHHNDSFSSNEGDWGTFWEPNSTYETIRKYVELDSRYTVQSGETSGLCNDFGVDPSIGSKYRDCTAAMTNLRRCHYSTISHYELWDVNAKCNTIKIWTDGGCEEPMKKLLGYRFRLVDGDFPETVTTNKLSISLTMANDGFARIYNRRDVELVLENAADGSVFRLPVIGVNSTTDSRLWLPAPEETRSLSLEVDLPALLTDGSYKLYLNLPDPELGLKDRKEYSIRLANEGTWDDSRGYNNLNHTVNISRYTGTASNGLNNNLNVYPNPGNLNCPVTIKSGSDKTSEVVISDLSGRMVYRTSFRSQLTISPSEIKLKAGFYLVSVITEKKVSSQKLIVR